MEDYQFQIDMLTARNKQLSDKEKMYQLICSTSQNAFLYVDFVQNEVRTLGNWNHYFDFTIDIPREIARIIETVPAQTAKLLQETLFPERSGAQSKTMECYMTDAKIWIQFESTVWYKEDGKPHHKIIRLIDVTQSKKQNEELRYMAYFDMLTGLYNRNYFVRILSEWTRDAKQKGETIAVMCIDIDNFKKINDGLGLVAGDDLIQAFGLILKGFMDDQTIVAHVTDDTYYLAVKNPIGEHNCESIFNQLQKRVEDPFKLIGGQEVYITFCVGVAEFPEAAHSSLELINCSEIVMFRAKEHGPNTIRYFEAPIFQDFIDNINMENKLKEAVDMNRFVLYYQPQYDSKTQKLRGVEALIRWRDESGKLISPGCFIPVAEKNGMIIPIGAWVLEEGIRSYAQWRKKFNCTIVLSLNISALQYKRADFVSGLLRILEKYRVDPKDIELEITESVLIDDFDQVVNKLHTLKDYGVKISLDDFGTGYSSLSYLKGLPIDTLKIDKSFIDTVIQDESTQVITESIVSMVKKLGFETVAEGVETKEQFDYLKKINCDNIQGFLLGKPMPEEELESLLSANNVF